MRCLAAARSLLLPLHLPPGVPIHTAATAPPPLAAELDAADALHALLATLPPSLPALLPCLSLLSRRLTPHSVADALLCAGLPAASRLRLFLFSALSPHLRSPLLHSRAVVPLLLSTDGDAAMFDAIDDARAAGLRAPSAAFEALVFAHASAGRHEEAVQAFARMDEFGCRPTTFVYNAVLKALVDSAVIPLALALYNRMVAAGCPPNRATYNVLMDGLCKRGMAGDALKLFDEMLERGIVPNVKTHTVLLSSLCNAGKLKDAEKLLLSMNEKGCPPDEVTYNSLLSGLCKAGRVDEAFERLELLRSGGFALGLKGYSCLIDGLFQAGRYNDGFECYKEMLMRSDVSPDIVLYTIMIRGCSEAGRTEDAVSFLDEMKEKGFVPDTFCYNTLLKTLCDAGNLDGARSLWSEMLQNNMVLDSTTHTIMICGLCKKGLLDEAMQVFNEMEKVDCHPTVMTYNVLIHGLYRVRRLEEARMLFYKMEMGNNPSLFLRLTLGANQVRDSESLQKLVNTMCQSGQVLKAYKLLRGIIDSGVVPDVVTYNTLIKGLCKVRNLDGALRLFKELELKGLSPDDITYGTLIDRLLRAHRENDARMLFQNILQSGGTPSLSIYNSMMRSLCRMKKLSQAISLWLDHLPKKYNLSAEDEVLADARKKIEDDSLDEAVRELIKIDQKYGSLNSTPYTIWLIGLCQARRIGDALKIFHTLEEFGIAVTPACCAFLTKYLCWERNLNAAVDVMLYTLSKRFIMSRHVGNRLLRNLCIHHRRQDAQALAWRMHLVGYDMDAYLREPTKGLLHSQ
ncbi:pentatricopeptide repeat-containing protein At1g79540-like [Phragmites australis]|uniref:pentatricopeptide repeat-containing protein At1g79540-like n=1 Tax=Phragmites australis TaxID=29695 RepID=UPI002D7A1865|nr:pentatricopeptide repeat-containing protein At1g79540-like [Phragmites australis]